MRCSVRASAAETVIMSPLRSTNGISQGIISSGGPYSASSVNGIDGRSRQIYRSGPWIDDMRSAPIEVDGRTLEASDFVVGGRVTVRTADDVPMENVLRPETESKDVGRLYVASVSSLARGLVMLMVSLADGLWRGSWDAVQMSVRSSERSLAYVHAYTRDRQEGRRFVSGMGAGGVVAVLLWDRKRGLSRQMLGTWVVYRRHAERCTSKTASIPRFFPEM